MKYIKAKKVYADLVASSPKLLELCKNLLKAIDDNTVDEIIQGDMHFSWIINKQHIAEELEELNKLINIIGEENESI